MAEESLRALLAEDNPGDARLLREMLVEAEPPGFRLTHTPRLDEALGRLGRERYDIVLLDLQLPDAQGFETFARAQVRAPHLPIIVLTGNDDRELALKAVRHGAQDYLVKGRYDTDLLVRAMRYAIQRKQAEEELRKHREHLAELVDERTSELWQANEQLRREVRVRKRAEEQIRTVLREKEVLLQELHDRVRNNLQVIASLLDMQTAYAEDPEARHALRESQNRVRALSFAQDALYQQADLATIDLAAYVHSIVEYLVEVYGNRDGCIAVEIQVDGLQLDLDTAVTCGMIINELASNALKHAFPAHWPGEEGLVRVELRPQGSGDFALIVRDNGLGLGPTIDPGGSQSLGLRLVAMLVRQLKGTMELDRQEGTAFTISFPASGFG
jgi:two-component sensor histidine kinase/CheY-like chemotaxis protein